MNVTLRQRQKGDKVSLYLDYYEDGKRKYEYLKMYLFPTPEKGKLTKEQKKHNDDTLALAEAIKSKRHVQIKNEEFGFRDTEKVKGSSLHTLKCLPKRERIVKAIGATGAAH